MHSYSGRLNPIVVNYCSPNLTMKCVSSIISSGVAPAEDIIVVDNASPDKSSEQIGLKLPIGAKLICSKTNNGFSAGINLGAREANHEFLLVLNPDTYFQDTSILDAIRVLDEQQDVGMIGLDLIYPHGERQYSGRRFYSVFDILGRRLSIGRYWPVKGRIDRHLMKAEWDAGAPFDADWVMGTGFLVRRDLFNKIGKMDEAYFLYMEDIELCARVWGAGYRVVCVPGAKLVHDHQRTSIAGPFSWAGRTHLKSLYVFFKKYRIPLFIPPSVDRIRR